MYLRVGDIVRLKWRPDRLYQVFHHWSAVGHYAFHELGNPGAGWFCFEAKPDLIELVKRRTLSEAERLEIHRNLGPNLGKEIRELLFLLGPLGKPKEGLRR